MPELSLSKIVSDGGYGIASMRKADRDLTVLKIVEIITRFRNKLNLHHNLTAEQIADISNMTCSEAWYFRLDDLELCFKMALMGKFGKIDYKIDSTDIFRFYDEYWTLREREFRNNEESKTNNVYEVFQNPTMQKVLEDVHSKMMSKQQTEVSSVKFRPEPLSEISIQIQSDWDKLPKSEQSTKHWDLRVYNDEVVEYSDFYEKRFKEITNPKK